MIDLKHDERTRPLWRLVSAPIAAYFASWYWLPHATSRVTVEGAPPAGPAVFAHWHRDLPFLLGHNGERRRWYLMSPAPYMEPVKRASEYLGLRMVMGTSGAGGQAALVGLKAALDGGESVVFAVDGPAGPPFQAKRGCVDLARAAGVPIMPMTCTSRRGRENAARWDRMRRPALFDDIVVRYGAPIDAAAGPVEAIQARVNEALRALD